MDIPALMKQYAVYVKSQAGQCIIAEGTYGDSFFYIIKGSVQVKKRIGENEETLRELYAGDFFGELALIHDKPRAASVIATEGTELYEMGRKSFSEMLSNHPEISIEILATSSNWLLESDKQHIEKLKLQTRELALLLQQKDQLTVSLERERALLAQEKEKYRSLVENSLVGVFVMQEDSLVFANNTFMKMIGCKSPEELRDISLDELFIPGTRIDYPTHSDAPGTQHYETGIMTARLEEKTFEIRTVPIVMNHEKAVLANAGDLTEQKRLERDNEKTRLQLMQESKLASIGFLAAGIAHNLNNPLASIYTVAQLLRQEHPDMDEAHRIILQCRNMMNIIKSLMIKSRMDQSDETIELDLNTLLTNELKCYEANLDFKHTIDKTYDLEEGLPVINGIYSDFTQAIMNLVQNAVDAMYESPLKRLSIRTYSDSDSIHLAITDTGCGIPEEEIPKIFDPFFSTKPFMSERKGNEPAGTGLGMASSLQLMQKYNGTIQVRSTPEAGTTVTVSIPRM